MFHFFCCFTCLFDSLSIKWKTLLKRGCWPLVLSYSVVLFMYFRSNFFSFSLASVCAYCIIAYMHTNTPQRYLLLIDFVCCKVFTMCMDFSTNCPAIRTIMLTESMKSKILDSSCPHTLHGLVCFHYCSCIANEMYANCDWHSFVIACSLDRL